MANPKYYILIILVGKDNPNTSKKHVQEFSQNGNYLSIQVHNNTTNVNRSLIISDSKNNKYPQHSVLIIVAQKLTRINTEKVFIFSLEVLFKKVFIFSIEVLFKKVFIFFLEVLFR